MPPEPHSPHTGSAGSSQGSRPPRMAPWAGALAVALVLAQLTGCSDTPATARTSGSDSPTPVPTTTTSPSPASPTAEITLAFAGDAHFAGRNATLLSNPETAFGPIASTLSSADLTMLNLETAVTERGTPQPKTYTFRAPATAFDALRASGVDVVSLANNHTLDYGQVGLADTLDSAAQADLPVVGAGRDAAEAHTPWITTIRGTRIAILAFSQIQAFADTWVATEDRPGLAMAMDVDAALASVAEARAQADLVVVYNHWGVERDSCPSDRQRTFAQQLADAGADIVIGSHAHTLQGEGFLGDTYVAYGMGNFLWYVSSSSLTSETGVLLLTVTGTTVTDRQFVPARVSSTGQPIALTGSDSADLAERFDALRDCAGLASS